jgi:hypothetical protein
MRHSAEITGVKNYFFTQGDAFCGREDDHMPDDCGALIDGLIPAAVPVLAADLVEHALELCTDVAGACP